MTPESQIPAPKRASVSEFAARIRSKYPQYESLDDGRLVAKVLKKYPSYSAHVDLSPEAFAQAEAEVSQAKPRMDQSANALMSAEGRKLNPPVDASAPSYFRPLTATEQAAQKRGEPIIISEAGTQSTVPSLKHQVPSAKHQVPSAKSTVAPELTSRPRTVTPAPVSLDPVIQGRMEQIEREKRQRETQQKVEQARQVMNRRGIPQGLLLPEGQRNQGAAYQPKFGLGQPYREWNPRAAEAHEKPGGMVMGEFRRREERDARIAREIRPQVVKDYFGMGAGVRQDIPPEIAEQQIAADPKLRQYIEAETERRAKLLEEREFKVSRVERGIEPELGLVDKLKDLKDRPEQLVPFINSVPEISSILKVGESADKLERGEDLTTEETVRLREFLASGKQGKSLAYQVADVVSGLPAFVGEFALTGGAYSSGKEAAVKGLQRILTKEGLAVVEKKLAGRIATKVATGLVGAAVQTLPSGATRIPEGVLYRQQSGEEFGKALRDTLTDQFIEIASERAGGLLSEIPLPKKLAAIRDAVTARWVSKVPGRTAEKLQKIVEKTGWHGPLGEIFEERVGDVAKYATGLQASPIPSLEQLAVEGLAFSLPGVVEAGANKMLQTKTPAPQTLIDYALNSPLTTAADKANLEKLVESGVTSAEDVQAILSGESSTPPVVEPKEVKPVSRPEEPVPSTAPEATAKTQDIIPENIRPQEIRGNITKSITEPVQEPAEAPPAEVKTQPSATESRLLNERLNQYIGHPTLREFAQKEIPDVVEIARNAHSWREFQDGIGELSKDKVRDGPRGGQTRVLAWLMEQFGPQEAYEALRSIQSQGQLAVEPTQSPATESQPTTAKEVTDELADSSVRPATLETDSLIAPGRATAPDKPMVADTSVSPETMKSATPKADSGLQPKVARSSPSSEEANHAIPTKLTDWGARLKTIAQSKNLDDLQALSDEMAAHEDDPRVVRLRGSIQEQIARARQPELPESPETSNKITEERGVADAPRRMNFTQFANSQGYPSDYDVLDHNDLSPNGRVSKRGRKAAQERQSSRAEANARAHQEFNDAIRRGEIIDTEELKSRRVTKEGLERSETESREKETKSQIASAESQIRTIENLGSMSHLPNGKLKKPYQRTVDTYKERIATLERELAEGQPKPESGQSSMFAKGESGSAVRARVEGNQVFVTNNEMKMVSEIYGELGVVSGFQSTIGGTFERKGLAMARNLDRLAERGRKGATELAQAVRQAADAGDGKVLLFTTEGTRIHEMFHESSQRSNKYLQDRHADFFGLVDTEAYRKGSAALREVGYPNNNPTLVEEMAAYIAQGKYDQLDLTRDEAVDWMFKWFQSFEAKNPRVNPRQFQEMSDEATKARDEVYRTESNASQPQSDQTLPSVQEGRESRDRASLARTSDITQTEAFKRWFGESKVVDGEGDPQIVFHGTTSSTEIEAFTVREGGAIFFAESPDEAARYADPSLLPPDYSSMYSAYLSVQNPHRLNDYKGTSLSYLVGGGLFTKEQAARILNMPFNEFAQVYSETARLLASKVESEDLRLYHITDNPPFMRWLKRNGYDGFTALEGGERLWGVLKPSQIKSATGNRGTFDPNNPNILFARSDDPWADLMELSDEFGRLANEPELAEGEKPRSLPKTLEAAGLEAGPARGYLPESIVDDGVERAKQVITEKGIDGAMEFVRTGDGIEWASTGYEVSGLLRAEEAALRAEGRSDEADRTRDKRLKFLDDFAMGAIERGRSIVGIKAIAEYAPDRMAYMLNKASLKKRKRGISPEEESRITKLGEELGALEDRNKALEKRLQEALSKAKQKAGTRAKTSKSDYASKLDEQARTVLQTLKPKVGKFDFSALTRPSEKGAVTLGIPPLPGDAELIAQYAAAQLGKLNTVSELNEHLVQEFGQDLEPHLSKIRQRAYAIRQEARLAEIESEETEPKRRKTILSEIQKEIGDSLRTIREAQKAQDLAAKAERAAERKSERTEARLEARRARERVTEEKKAVIKEARRELKRLRQEMKEASKAETKGYRESIKAQKDAARKAELWDTPIRNEAEAARTRLASVPRGGSDINDPSVMEDLVSVAAAKFLPEKEGGTPRTGAVEPARVYRDLKNEFPNLVTKKNQAEIYKRGYQRIQDATAAAREAARMRSASAEAKRLWDELGVDVDAQAVLIQQAEVRRQTDELRRKAVAEFNRVNKTMLERVWMEAQSIPRALQSSIDAPLGRQGAYFLLTHPVQTIKAAVPATLQGYGSIHVVDYARHETDLKKHPDYDLATKSGLDLSVTSGGGDPALVAEEQFQSPLASRFFPHVRLSEQGYVLGMNAQRLAMFSRLADTGRADGYTPETHPEFFEEVARFVNDGTGRGNLPDAIKRASALTNFFFFSTRLNISRIQLLNDLFNPVKYVPEQANPLRAVPGFGSYDPAMRKVMAKELIRLSFSLLTIYLVAAAMGIKIDLDPDHPDGLFLRIRNTRYDITGGEAGTIRFLYRFMRSIYFTANGEDLQPSEQPLSIASRFTRYKLAPIPGGVIDALSGKDAVGQPANLRKFDSPKQVIQQNILVKRLLPMMTGNLIDAVSEEGWIGLPMTLPALAGFGMSSYPDRGIRAIRNQSVVDALEDLKITSQSLLGQKTKDDELDKAIESRIMQKVETLDIPTGATDIGKEKITRERLAQIRLLAKAEAALADPERYKHYLSEREAGESLSFLTDDEKKTLTEDDLKAYRQSYAENYLKTLQRVASSDNYQKADDDKKEKILARVGQAAHTLAKVGMVKTKRKGTQ